MPYLSIPVFLASLLAGNAVQPFPPEITEFIPYQNNPVFEAGGPDCWDAAIRERGWILREDGLYHLWYTGYQPGDAQTMKLGGLLTAFGPAIGNPIYSEHWVEDMMVVKLGPTYYMFAEGKVTRPTCDLRRSPALSCRSSTPQSERRTTRTGPFGTPAALYEDGTWYLFYERNDEAVWVATSRTCA